MRLDHAQRWGRGQTRHHGLRCRLDVERQGEGPEQSCGSECVAPGCRPSHDVRLDRGVATADWLPELGNDALAQAFDELRVSFAFVTVNDDEQRASEFVFGKTARKRFPEFLD